MQNRLGLGTSVHKETAEEKAYRLIVDAILYTYKPGDFLLERTLATFLDMSRTPITIALNRLISEGLIVKLPKKGCYIPPLDPTDAKKAFHVRKLMEIDAGQQIVQAQNIEVIQTLQQLITDTAEAVRVNDVVKFTALDVDFHHTIVRLAENSYLYEAWKRIYLRCNIYTRYFDFHYTRDNLFKENTLQEHIRIVDAIAANDIVETTKGISLHIDSALSCIC